MKLMRILLILTGIFMVGCDNKDHETAQSMDINKSVLEQNETKENQIEVNNENKKDNITFEGYEIKDDGYGYYISTCKVKNNTNKKMIFQGINIYELDNNGDILDSWESYNQNAVDAELEPGQSISFDTMYEINSGIEQIKSTSYSYIDEYGEWIEKDFLKPIIMDIAK